MERLLQDLTFAVRRLAKTKLFTAIAVVSLAIGIGANTAVFSLINAVILRELPLKQPEQLVDVYRSVAGFSHGTFSYPDMQDLRTDMTDVFSEIAGSRLAFVQADKDDGVEMLSGELVTGNMFPLLGVPAHMGRTILPDDDVSPGGHPVVMLSYAYWQSRYAGDPNVVGQEIRLNGRMYSVIGIAHPEYTGSLRGLEPAVYASIMMVQQLNPTDFNELESRGSSNLFLKARLKPGVTEIQAQAAADRMAATFAERFPDSWSTETVIPLVKTEDVIMNPMIDKVIVPAAAMLLGVVGLVLLIACANLASFLLAQAAERKKEIAIRLAIGAGRGRLIRQLLTESLLLSIVGGAAGIVLAKALLSALLNADLPLPFPITLDLSLDTSVLAFAFGVTLVAGVMFGLAPAWQATNPDLAPTLKDESTGGGVPKRFTLRKSLIVAQVGMSFMLLVGSGLFLRSLDARSNVDPGFGYEPAAMITLQVPPDKYSEEQSRIFFESFLNEIEAVPGVAAAGMMDDVFLSTMNNQMTGVNVPGVEPPPDRDFHAIDYASIDPGIFEALDVGIVDGRPFDDRDVADGAPVIIVSEAFARHFWPEDRAVGKMVRIGDSEVTVVGVARNAKIRSLGEAPRDYIYFPYEQRTRTFMTVVAKTDNDEQMAANLVSMARALEPEIIIYETRTIESHMGVMLLAHRLSAMIVSAFGFVALLLASIGLYGVVSYAVAMRKREMGIRLALGAESGNIIRLLMQSGMKLVLIGGAAGLILSVAAAKLLSGLLYGITAFDPVAFVAGPAALVGVALLASWLPARRAGNINPVQSIKGE
ncbi:MAG: ABC transporter permease [Gemmatimonadota bacterium]|nr:ABC transporter permease [Gemmatimonadota bacterium]